MLSRMRINNKQSEEVRVLLGSSVLPPLPSFKVLKIKVSYSRLTIDVLYKLGCSTFNPNSRYCSPLLYFESPEGRDSEGVSFRVVVFLRSRRGVQHLESWWPTRRDARGSQRLLARPGDGEGREINQLTQ
jgi:hypothetical protein